MGRSELMGRIVFSIGSWRISMRIVVTSTLSPNLNLQILSSRYINRPSSYLKMIDSIASSIQARIPKTANRPKLSSHPITRCIRKNIILCCSQRISSLLIRNTACTGLPNNCSQALSLQTSFPAAMQPVSSKSVPMILGLRRSGRDLEQCGHGVVSSLA